MKLKIVDISEANFQHLFDWSREAKGQDVGCKFCLYWEEPNSSKWPGSLDEREKLKRQLFRKVRTEFGACGKLAFIGSRAVGYSQFSPPRYLPNVTEYECGPPSNDAVLISCLFVREQQKKGIGSILIQAILEDLNARHARAVETFALKGSANNPSGPLDFWLRNGFYIVREDEHFALVRKESR